VLEKDSDPAIDLAAIELNENTPDDETKGFESISNVITNRHSSVRPPEAKETDGEQVNENDV